VKSGAAALAALLLSSSALAQEPPPPRFEAEVTRVRLDARVIGPGGRPILGLRPADFVLRVDGRVVPIESVSWIGAGVPGVGARSEEDVAPVPAGRLVVFLFQVDLHPTRTPGLMKLLQESQRLVRSFEPGDRVAVVSFDSRLRVWQDFTADKQLACDVIRRSVLFREPVGRRREGIIEISEEEAAGAASMEEALRVVAHAIEPLPGSKSLVLVGATMGHSSGGSVFLGDAYYEARDSFARSHTAVFALDTTDADAHTLDFGLQQVAEDTGGFFARTHQFATLHVNRVRGALAGHYLLAFERPPGDAGQHEVELELADGRGDVFTAPGYVD
jgi:VWFA-related protein